MFICEICGKEFKSLGGLRTHIAQYERVPIREYLLKYHSEECICPICGKEKKWIRDHFGKTCGDKDCVKKYRELDCLEKYGAKTPLESQIIRDKIKDTNIDKYGSEWYVTTEEFKNKSKETKLDKYGDEFYSYMTDSEGNVIVENPETGYYVYATLLNNSIVHTNVVYETDILEVQSLNEDIDYLKADEIPENIFLTAFEFIKSFNTLPGPTDAN